ncbi:hypothetical protein [Cellulomonas oligotrophica]|uniref:Roadblock/LAMTOR2 domain-containing protein n=1 Tax=Cellulomonas oligotrophica TaxID=931536 RepID=A0A7Y9FDR4_9CELL|nr:hypothetical protein [Cellulomonas oligotrophica]NYD85481.1 hypothetical protein [Cellulomonas oligotrophica]GIG31510.1 hypothetical protein Col01nite_06690 [Cellulomonas oligotrophica]
MDDPARDVVDRLHRALDEVTHVLVLDPGDRVVLADDGSPEEVVVAARAVATTLMLVDGAGEGGIRAVVETPGATVYATLVPGGTAFVLLGPPGWNVVLARRTLDPVVADLLATGAVDRLRDGRRTFLPAAAGPAVTGPATVTAVPEGDRGVVPTPGRGGTLAQAARAEAVRRRTRAV